VDVQGHLLEGDRREEGLALEALGQRLRLRGAEATLKFGLASSRFSKTATTSPRVILEPAVERFPH